jgi:3-oxoadipate enol-lactonase
MAGRMRRLILRLGLALLAWLLLTREHQPRFSPPQTHPLRAPGRTVFVGDVEVFIREVGDPGAPPLLLVHGWGDHSLVVFHALIPLLARNFRVIAPDLRNTGKTDAIRGPYEIADVADEVAGLIDVLGLAPVDVVGYSMGGMVTQELVRRHPHAVRRMVLAGTASTPPTVGRFGRTLAPIVIAFLRAGERITRTFHTLGRTKWMVSLGAIRPEHQRWAWTQHVSRDPELYWEAGLAVARWDSADWVGSLGTETLVVINTNDEVVATPAQYELAARIPGAAVTEVVGAYHAGPITHADRYASAITDFLT